MSLIIKLLILLICIFAHTANIMCQQSSPKNSKGVLKVSPDYQIDEDNHHHLSKNQRIHRNPENQLKSSNKFQNLENINEEVEDALLNVHKNFQRNSGNHHKLHSPRKHQINADGEPVPKKHQNIDALIAKTEEGAANTDLDSVFIQKIAPNSDIVSSKNNPKKHIHSEDINDGILNTNIESLSSLAGSNLRQQNEKVNKNQQKHRLDSLISISDDERVLSSDEEISYPSNLRVNGEQTLSTRKVIPNRFHDPQSEVIDAISDRGSKFSPENLKIKGNIQNLRVREDSGPTSEELDEEFEDYEDEDEGFDDNLEEETNSGGPKPPDDFSEELDGDLDFGTDIDSSDGNRDSLPVFLEEPKHSYVIKNKPATLWCKAANALQLEFKCSGTSEGRPPPGVRETHVDPQNGIRFLESSAEISRDMIEEYFGRKGYRCHCIAVSARGQIKSQSALVQVAYIYRQKSSLTKWIPARVELGESVELRCSGPRGNPKPRLRWIKNYNSNFFESKKFSKSANSLEDDDRTKSGVALAKGNEAKGSSTIDSRIGISDGIRDASVDDFHDFPISNSKTDNSNSRFSNINPDSAKISGGSRSDSYSGKSGRSDDSAGEVDSVNSGNGFVDNSKNSMDNADGNVLVTDEGHLLINNARLEDSGNYTCIAENIAGRRISSQVMLTVYVDGGWSSWSAWTPCDCPLSQRSSQGHSRSQRINSSQQGHDRITSSARSLSQQGRKRMRYCNNPSPVNDGRKCPGKNVQRTTDCVQCPVYSWSPWSEWSTCSEDCIQLRTRTCEVYEDYPFEDDVLENLSSSSSSSRIRRSVEALAQTSSSNRNSQCLGKDKQIAQCRTDACSMKNQENELPLYIGLGLVGLVCVLLVGALIRGLNLNMTSLSDRRIRRINNIELQPETTTTTSTTTASMDKKQFIQQQPDISHREPSYEYPVNSCAYSLTRTISSDCNQHHHYDVPHLTDSYAMPVDNILTGTCTETSMETTSNSSNSTYDMTVASQNAVSTIKRTAVTSSGGRVRLDAAMIVLNVPEYVVARGKTQEIFLSVFNEDNERIKLPEGMTQISPVVCLGPSDVHFGKPIVLELPHCAEFLTNWRISVYHDSSCASNAIPRWEKIVTLGEETINTLVYTHIDENNAYILTDLCGKFVLTGESNLNFKESVKNVSCAVKRLRLCIFGPVLGGQNIADYNIRLYVLEDLPSMFSNCLDTETKLGGVLLHHSKTLLFQDNGNNLSLNLRCTSNGGWNAKPCSEHQEIPFKHIWNSCSNSLHCSFSLEQTLDISNTLKFNITVYQNLSEQTYVSFDVAESICRNNFCEEKQMCITENFLDTRYGDRILTAIEETNENYVQPTKTLPLKNVTIDKCGGTCLTTDQQFPRLSRSLKKSLCLCLDPPNIKGNDWRMLAQKLSVDRYINYFATKASPTEHILDLWECVSKHSSALVDLVLILKSMEREDAVSIMEQCLGPSWL